MSPVPAAAKDPKTELQEVLQGRKQGFEIPLLSWLRNDLHEVLMDTLGVGSARVREHLSGRFIDDLLEGKVLRDRNWAFTVYMLMVLELWLGEFAGRPTADTRSAAVLATTSCSSSIR